MVGDYQRRRPHLLDPHNANHVAAKRHSQHHSVYVRYLRHRIPTGHFQTHFQRICLNDTGLIRLGLLLPIPLHKCSSWWWRRWRDGIHCTPFRKIILVHLVRLQNCCSPCVLESLSWLQHDCKTKEPAIGSRWWLQHRKYHCSVWIKRWVLSSKRLRLKVKYRR